METRQDERSLGELFGDLSRELSALVRQEITLARLEVTQKLSLVGKNVALLVAGAALLYAAFLTLMATIIIAIANALPWWLAALIVTVVVAGVGAALALKGIDTLKQTQMAPQQTIQTLKEDATWMKEQTT
ncbi:MAG: phage holin family protein [Ktedonobacterales bacterium]|nr:phage holin family protein [Ktedonobacterales bacterium]